MLYDRFLSPPIAGQRSCDTRSSVRFLFVASFAPFADRMRIRRTKRVFKVDWMGPFRTLTWPDDHNLCFVWGVGGEIPSSTHGLILIERFVSARNDTELSLCNLLQGTHRTQHQRWKSQARRRCHGVHINIHHPSQKWQTPHKAYFMMRAIYFSGPPPSRRRRTGVARARAAKWRIRIYVYSGVRYNKLGLARLDLPFQLDSIAS